jgi:hypothetical protein
MIEAIESLLRMHTAQEEDISGGAQRLPIIEVDPGNRNKS